MSGPDGIEAATELFERLIAEVADRRTPRLAVDEELRALDDGGARIDGTTVAQMRASVARAVDLYADLFREMFDLYADLVEVALGARGTSVSAAGGGGPVALTGRAGRDAAAPVWLHNATAAPLRGVMLRVTDLAAHDGATVAGARAAFSPAALDIAPRASASATLALAVPPRTQAGAYHGLVLASGLPAASVPVLLVVE